MSTKQKIKYYLHIADTKNKYINIRDTSNISYAYLVNIQQYWEYTKGQSAIISTRFNINF